MVRTRANNAAVRKSVVAKAPRKNVSAPVRNINSPSVTRTRKGSAKRIGGNPVKIRPTPSWQKGIDLFLSKSNKDDIAGCSSGCGPSGSGMSSKATSLGNVKNKENDDVNNKDVETIEIPDEENQDVNGQGSNEEQEENQGSDEEQENQGSDEEQENQGSDEEQEENQGSDEEQENQESELEEDEGPNEDIEDEQEEESDDENQTDYLAILGDDIAEVESD